MAQLPWVRMDTSIPSHPKVLTLVHDGAWRALACWHFAMEWCGAAGTAGYVPHYALGAIHARQQDMAKLVEVGLLELAQGGWQLHNYGDRNMADEDSVKRSRQAATNASKRWDQRKGKPAKRGGHLREVQGE